MLGTCQSFCTNRSKGITLSNSGANSSKDRATTILLSRCRRRSLPCCQKQKQIEGCILGIATLHHAVWFQANQLCYKGSNSWQHKNSIFIMHYTWLWWVPHWSRTWSRARSWPSCQYNDKVRISTCKLIAWFYYPKLAQTSAKSGKGAAKQDIYNDSGKEKKRNSNMTKKRLHKKCWNQSKGQTK
jgi:hypothetical protein